ncbi:unnamed protein product, partial [Adineta steineri]
KFKNDVQILVYDVLLRMRSVIRHLLPMITGSCLMPDALMYDCACTLKLHWNKWLGTEMLKMSARTQQLPTHLALDNFHQKTHTRSMCQTIMKSDHPSYEGRFVGLNSQAAEQAFQYISRLFLTPCVYQRFGTLNGEELNKDEDDDQSDLDHNVTSEDMS